MNALTLRKKHRQKRRRNPPEIDDGELRQDAPRPPKFRVLPTDSPIDRIGAIYALRMIEGARLYPSMIRCGDIRDHDLLSLVGLELEENRGNALTPALLSEAMAEQAKRLQGTRTPRLKALESNAARIAKVLRLGRVESDVLQLAVIVSHVAHFNDLFNLGPFMPQHFCKLVRLAIGHSTTRLQDALSPAGRLRRVGLLNERCRFDHGTHPLEMDCEIAGLILSPRFDETRVLRHLLRTPPAATLAPGDFPDTPEIQLLRRYILSAVKERRVGANILIHGAPGTGKTEFARVVTKECGFELSEVPSEDESGDAISGQDRFRAFSLAQNLLSPRRNQLLLFDEVEDVFGLGRPGMSFFGLGSRGKPEELTKGWINQTLESNPVTTIWVCNNISSIDPAYLRRFDLTVEFRSPTQKVRRRIVERHFPKGALSEQGIDRLAAMEGLPPAQVERAARVVQALNSQTMDERDFEAERVATLSLRAMGLRGARSAGALPAHYDPAFLNTDRDLTALANGLRGGRHARLCLFGPPGTGKTAFGHHLARVLDKPLHIKRASDLLSMWLGETEQNLARAFQDATDEGAILLIDEADSFLRDRGNAQRSWEVSQVNEMLTQMEAFDGIFIASTNLVDSLDAASLRRFDFKVRFDHLKREQRRALFSRVVQPEGGNEIGDEVWRRLDRMDRLVPGDIANVLRQLRTTGEAPIPNRLLDLLEAELRFKPGTNARSIGF